MLSQHVGKGLTEEQRTRWVTLLLQSAREAGLPNDAEFRSAFGAYPSGVVAVAAQVRGQLTGIAASSFTSVSIDPPLVSFSVATISRPPTMSGSAYTAPSSVTDHASDSVPMAGVDGSYPVRMASR